MKRIEIFWRDAHRYTYQMSADESVDIVEIKSLGYLVSKDKRKVVISQDDIESNLRGVQAIPTENIIKIKYL